jgi:hypothetical protein
MSVDDDDSVEIDFEVGTHGKTTPAYEMPPLPANHACSWLGGWCAHPLCPCCGPILAKNDPRWLPDAELEEEIARVVGSLREVPS